MELNVSYKYKLENKRTEKWNYQMRKKLVVKLQELNVKVNNPFEMPVKQLEMLVNHHRKTVESRDDYLTQKHLEIAERNGLTKEDVEKRVETLNWDISHAVKVKKQEETREERRERRKRERLKMIQQLNELEEAEGLK